MKQGNQDTGSPKLTIKRMLGLLMQEIADVRKELKEEMAEVKQDIRHVDQRLGERIDSLASEFRAFRIEVHQNQISFMSNHDHLEKRVTVLETKVG